MGASTGIPSALTNVNSITAAASTNLTLNAGSGNQNIVFAPTGSGISTTSAPLTITNATASISNITGALTVSGGLGVASAAYIGTTLNVGTSASIPALSNLTTNGFVKTSGGNGTLLVDTNTYLTAAGAVTSITGTTNQVSASASTGPVTLSLPSAIITPGSLETTTTLKVDSTTASTSTTTGSLTTAGGIGISGSAYIGTSLTTANIFAGSPSAAGQTLTANLYPDLITSPGKYDNTAGGNTPNKWVFYNNPGTAVYGIGVSNAKGFGLFSGDQGFTFSTGLTQLDGTGAVAKFTISNAGLANFTNTTASTSTTTGALTVSGGLGVAGAVNQGGKTTTYNNVTTAGIGTVPVYGLDNRTGLTGADGAATTIYTTVASGGLFRITADIFATAAVTGTATYTITWTQNAGTRTLVVTATAINTLGTATNLINPDNATNITTQLTGTFTGTFTVAGVIEQLK